MNSNDWQIPNFSETSFSEKENTYCLCIPVINEGNKLLNELGEIKAQNLHNEIDIIICDGGSDDGSTETKRLRELGVNTLLVKKDTGKLSAQLRMGYSYALKEGYQGIVTIDGNNKDNVDAILNFIEALNQGFDLVQGSRYIEGGKAINTPKIRHMAVKLIHIPIISFASGFDYTDTTNGYRAYSRRFLLDERVKPFRKIFDTYELLAYLSVRAPELGFKTTEIPVIREYPKIGKTPTKISFLKGNLDLLKILFDILLNKYDPER